VYSTLPLYEYRCKQCGHQFEKIQSFSAPEEKECPVCHGEIERLISAPAIQFKGAGWYVNDYAAKGSKSAPKSGDSGSSSEKPAGGAASSSDGSGESGSGKSGSGKPASDSSSSSGNNSGSTSGAGSTSAASKSE
jgi:putative FmdB family regulatory protein